ncbi:NAD(P)H nitroreductase [Mycolicibacterium flavescens]|uniref:NAD(P)H nitroreductase n=1 Tax=Mycolicibacterium flavescens TaxID=1776 RepID=A0A1E3R8L5_MYCFV|nr:NAD(P)H nitroreductase [Mycolicibacterium flavescens]MCV7282621.1 NAD(P)H nitroreductase [Mycolicibacterium flavescens]ODQ86091.1 NAD(P)H nitroreductase [Mycolicibacterium flavescens]
MGKPLVTTDVLTNAIRVACRAPSLHNSQPWHWTIDGAVAHLFLDKNRVLPAHDHSGREALLACGAVLDHLRVAMAAAGWDANIERYPNPNNTLHLATIEFSPISFVTEGHRRRADAILLRRTDRLPFAEPADWPAVEAQLRRFDATEYVRLDVIADDLRPELAQASRLTESLRFYDSYYHEELQWWTAPFEMREGIPRGMLPTAAESDRVAIGRSFPVSHDEHNRRSAYGDDRSKVVVLSTYDDDRASVLRCGETLSAVLLNATVSGLATCTLSHITELRASRDIVAYLIDRVALPQLLIRVGSAPKMENPPPATPRRPLTEVLDVKPR